MSKIIKTKEELLELQKKLTGKLVATNGCFDILHVGHIRYLIAASELGDTLIVGLNSDNSVSRLKGSSRPINNQSDRAEVLSALECIDFIYIFDQEEATEFLGLARPDIYAKGGDYELDTLPERDILTHIGCQVAFLDFHDGYSSSKIIERL